jgi:hypothetical protein
VQVKGTHTLCTPCTMHSYYAAPYTMHLYYAAPYTMHPHNAAPYSLLNTYRPGTIAKVHESKLAFKQVRLLP